ncbi:hypothetical protein Tco_0577214, partial [Tanacetum coccineum]
MMAHIQPANDKTETEPKYDAEAISEGLGHILWIVEQFCDGDLEVAFRSNTCYVQNLEGEYLLTGSRDSNLYTIS